jgi:hypothetical protein
MGVLTWGCELEFGDVPRWLEIPENLGSWEYFETDIVNQREPYYGIASDPFGIDPPFGGEINTKPTKTWAEQIKIISEIIRYFTELGYPPTISCVQQFHIHVGIASHKKEKLDLMKNLINYISNNQKNFIEITSGFIADEKMSNSAIDFLKDNGGLSAPKQMYDSMLECGTFKEMIQQDTTEINNNILKRYGINLKSFLYNNTIEFRSFRASLNLREIIDAFRICETLMINGLTYVNTPITEIIKKGNYNFPPFVYDHELFLNWEKTKKPNRAHSNKIRNGFYCIQPNIRRLI